MVNSESGDNKQLVSKIQSMGREFALGVFKSVNEFVSAVFETLLAMYDPDIEGYLEDVERDLDRLALTRTVFGQTYYVLIVLSRVMNKDKDKDLRMRISALANVSPQDFGVDEYLLLNEQTPMMKMVKTQEQDYLRISTQMMHKSSTRRSQTLTNSATFLPSFNPKDSIRSDEESSIFNKIDGTNEISKDTDVIEEEPAFLEGEAHGSALT